MFELLCKCFIRNYNDTDDEKVRERYGLVFSIFSIVCNIVLVIFKMIVSFISNSFAIRADALNNLSDVGSNLATLFGFKLSIKHPDADHPYGHGRMEYVSGMIVSFLILYMAFEAIKEAITKIINPEQINYSNITLIILIVSVMVKYLMAIMNRKAGDKIASSALKAAAQDSLNDMLMTGATIISMLVYRIYNVNIDSIVGLIASLFVLKSGIEIFTDVLDTILGKAPDKELIKAIEKDILAHKEILGIHDLLLHDYGPSHQFMSLHAEVDASGDVIELHDLIDNIEMEILNKYKILTTIHMDPIDTKDELVNSLKEKTKQIVRSVNKDYSIHDFRIVRGNTHTNLVFDVLIPAQDQIDHEELKKTISDKVAELDSSYRCVIQIDHSFV